MNDNNPIIDKLSWHFEIEKRHREAGFDPVSHDFLTDRFQMYINWMKEEFILKPEFKVPQNSIENIEIRKNDFTVLGWGFCQKYHDKFIDRMYKSKTIEDDQRFLNKWLLKYKEGAEPVI